MRDGKAGDRDQKYPAAAHDQDPVAIPRHCDGGICGHRYGNQDRLRARRNGRSLLRDRQRSAAEIDDPRLGHPEDWKIEGALLEHWLPSVYQVLEDLWRSQRHHQRIHRRQGSGGRLCNKLVGAAGKPTLLIPR
jgi:hypothetical protein